MQKAHIHTFIVSLHDCEPSRHRRVTCGSKYETLWCSQFRKADLAAIGLPGTAVQRLNPARLCYNMPGVNLDLLMQTSSVAITYSFPGNRFTVVASLEEHVVSSVPTYETCFLLPIFNGNIVSGTQYSVHVVSIDYVHAVLQPAVRSTTAESVLLQWATNCRLRFPSSVIAVFGLPMTLLIFDVTGVPSQTLDLSTYVAQTFVDLPVHHDAPYASLALVPSAGQTVVSAQAIYTAYGVTYPGDSLACLLTVTCAPDTYLKAAAGTTNAACCEVPPTYSIDVTPLASVSDGVTLPVSVAPFVLGARWTDDDSLGVLQYKEDVVGVPSQELRICWCYMVSTLMFSAWLAPGGCRQSQLLPSTGHGGI